MSEYISREEFERHIKPYDTEDHTDKALYNFAHNHMICCPSADVRPNIHGHWESDMYDNSVTCDKCGCCMDLNDIMNGDGHFCPNCGADMREVSK